MKTCKRCGAEHDRKTSTLCSPCGTIDARERRQRKMAEQGKQLCPVCKTYQKYSTGHACPKCIAAAQNRESAHAARTLAARAKLATQNEERALLEDPPTHKRCSLCEELKPINEFSHRTRVIRDSFFDVIDERPEISSHCKPCARAYTATNRKTINVALAEPWHVIKLNSRVYAVSAKGLDKEELIKRLTRKGANLKAGTFGNDYALHVYAPTMRGNPYFQCESIDGCLKQFRDFLLLPMQNS